MSLLDSINDDIQKHIVNATCGTAININSGVYNTLIKTHSAFEINKLFKGVDVLFDDGQPFWSVENWEQT